MWHRTDHCYFFSYICFDTEFIILDRKKSFAKQSEKKRKRGSREGYCKNSKNLVLDFKISLEPLYKSELS